MDEQNQQRLLRGYEDMLHRLRVLLEKPDALTRPRFNEALSAAKTQTIDNGDLTEEEAERIAGYLRRDLQEAARYPAEGDQDLSGWLYMDLRLIEDWLWDTFSSVADKTRIELMAFNPPPFADESEHYRSGEIIGPGAIRCLGCESQLEFERVGAIPQCPNCGEEEFVRAAAPREE